MFTDVAGRRGGRLARVHAHLLLASLVLAGCTASLSTGPTRLYTVADETSLLRTQVASIESNFSLGVAQNEAARNEVIAERMLGMPKDPSFDTNRPFRDVPKNSASAAR